MVDSLVGRIGSDQWQALSYKEKQQKLAALDAQVIEQEKIGKIFCWIYRFLHSFVQVILCDIITMQGKCHSCTTVFVRI